MISAVSQRHSSSGSGAFTADQVIDAPMNRVLNVALHEYDAHVQLSCKVLRRIVHHCWIVHCVPAAVLFSQVFERLLVSLRQCK